MTSFNVIYNIIAQDKFSAAGKKFAAMARKIKSNVGTMSVSLDKAKRKFKSLDATIGKAGRGMTKFGKAFSLKGGVAAAAFAGNALRLFNTQAQAVAKVEALIKSTGGTAKLSLKEITAEASRLQTVTLYGDEAILDSMAQLLTFTDIKGAEFKRTQAMVMDLSTVLGTDMKSSAILLGKALNDPAKGLSMMTRVGIKFSDSQTITIKALQKTGDLMGAQNMVLKILEGQYGGTAKAAALAGTGPLTQLWNILGDINEVIGKEIMIIIKPFIAKIKEMAIAFQGLSPAVKKTIAIVALIVTVVGPLIMIIGTVIAMLPFMAAGWVMVSAAMSPILIPILAVIAAFTAAYYIGTMIVEWLTEMPALWNAIGAVIFAIINPIDTVIGLFDKMMNYDFSNILGDIGGLLGFGDSSAEINSNSSSQSKVDINLNAPQGVIASTKSRSDGGTKLNVGTNMMATAQ